MTQTLICSQTNQSISLTKQIARSGEGEVWQTSRSGYLAKIYHSPTSERLQKLEVMIANPPEEPNAHLGHVSFAWPCSLLRDSHSQSKGFLMPEIVGGRELIELYNPQRRKSLGLEIDWRFLHVTALNIASIVQKIHAEGYVLGDIKPQNILVTNRALPAIIDTDSFQVTHTDGTVHHCPVGTEEFTPAELLQADLRQTTQTEIHDRFRLGIILYLLLFGDHPFKGKWVGFGESPEPVELIRRGYWPYAPNSPLQPGPLTIPLKVVHPEIRRAFLRCFNKGYAHFESRPSASDWYQALKVAIEDLQPCKAGRSHVYSNHSRQCPWCDRAKTLSVDIFSSKPVSKPSPLAELLQQLQANVTQTVDHVKEAANAIAPQSFPQRQRYAPQPTPSWTLPTIQIQLPNLQLSLPKLSTWQPPRPSLPTLSLPDLSVNWTLVSLVGASLLLTSITIWHYSHAGGIGNFLGLFMWVPLALFFGLGGAIATDLKLSSKLILALGIPALGLLDSLVNPQSFWPGGWLVLPLSFYLLAQAFDQSKTSM